MDGLINTNLLVVPCRPSEQEDNRRVNNKGLGTRNIDRLTPLSHRLTYLNTRPLICVSFYMARSTNDTATRTQLVAWNSVITPSLSYCLYAVKRPFFLSLGRLPFFRSAPTRWLRIHFRC